MAKRSGRARSKSKGRDKDKDSEKGKRKSRIVARSSGANHMPFMVAGGGLLVLIVVGIMVKVSNDQARAESERLSEQASAQRAEEATQAHERQMAHYTAGGAPTAASKSTSSGAAMATRRSAWANARIQIAIDKRASGDKRYLKAFCGSCSAQLVKKVASCPKCRAKLRWQEKVTCDFCSDAPKVELGADQSKVGFCGQCNGTGKNPDFKAAARLPFGMSTDATGQHGEKCPACKGSGRCIHCGGRGRFTVPDFFGS